MAYAANNSMIWGYEPVPGYFIDYTLESSQIINYSLNSNIPTFIIYEKQKTVTISRVNGNITHYDNESGNTFKVTRKDLYYSNNSVTNSVNQGHVISAVNAPNLNQANGYYNQSSGHPSLNKGQPIFSPIPPPQNLPNSNNINQGSGNLTISPGQPVFLANSPPAIPQNPPNSNNPNPSPQNHVSCPVTNYQNVNPPNFISFNDFIKTQQSTTLPASYYSQQLVIWEWEDQDKYVRYSDECCQMIERAFKNKEPEVLLTNIRPGIVYKIVFANNNFLQFNMQTGYSVRVKRV